LSDRDSQLARGIPALQCGEDVNATTKASASPAFTPCWWTIWRFLSRARCWE
jgi:hypothetical protein